MNKAISRREFLQTMAATAGVVLVASGCNVDGEEGEAKPKPQTALKNPDGTFTVKGAGKLTTGTAMGFMLPATTSENEMQPAIVFMTLKGEMRALSALCTHSGCTVVWTEEKNDNLFLCPCHASRFDTHGKVLNGPAAAPLTAYGARKQGEDAVISI